MDVSGMRTEYRRGRLDAEALGADPLAALAAWIEAADAAGAEEPNAMALATVSADGVPSARFVLCKGVAPGGAEAPGTIRFFTNYASRKGRDLDATGVAAATFWWDRLERQVRLEGTVARLDPEASDAYFASRPRGSRVGAWASPQGREVDGREALERLAAEAEARFEGQDEVPRPAFWGGYALTPTYVEFWQGRASRLHDRIAYAWTEGAWRTSRLAP
jgi:pyridoxamine 5'-phosphate oxidase